MISLILRVCKTILGFISCVIGALIIVWCLYNVFVRLLPEYTGPPDFISLLIGGFGIGSVLFSYGLKWLRFEK